MRIGKLNKNIRVSNFLKELPTYDWNVTCYCKKCNCYWKLRDTLYCPDCGTNRYKVLEP